MPSTYTPSLKLEIIANGEQSTTWGETTNNNMGTLIEQAITGVQPITLTGDTVLTNFNGISDQSRNAVLVFNGALANSANVVVPSEPKVYILSNRAGANVIVKTASSNGVTLGNGVNTYVYCDGTNFFTAVDTSNITGDLTVSGNQTVGGSIAVGGNFTLKTKITSNTGTLSLTSSTGVVDMATNTGAFTPPYGTDAERPGTPELGMTRWNSDQGILEIWNGVQWQNITGNYAVEYVIVAGGGGGGYGPFTFGGGGGAGGMISNATTVTVGTAYSVTIGAGGSSSNGGNSNVFSMTAIGGGQGSTGSTGSSGGSGGGGDPYNNGGSGTSGQGFAGVRGAVLIDGQTAIGGGGGGAGAIGGGTLGYVADGGAGNASSITGTSTYYAGGGGGAGEGSGTVARGGYGGIGGGGRGGGGEGGGSLAGTANTGGGGGAGGSSAGGAAPGGSGIAIIRYASASQRGTGGTVTSYSDAGITYFVHTFTTSGTFTA